MSVYDNETKIYPDLNPATPQEPQTYFLNETEVREQIAKKMKPFNTITGIADNRPNYIDGDHWSKSIAAFASGG